MINFLVGHNYIGLISVDQQSDVTMKDLSETHLQYLKPLADFVIPKSQIKLMEILGKGNKQLHDINNHHPL